jgi:hypothetical protein
MKSVPVFWAFVLSLAILGQVEAGQPQLSATINATTIAGGIIGANDSETERSLPVDSPRKARFLITSPAECNIVIDLPDGSRMTPDAGLDDRRRWFRFTSAPGANQLLLPGVGPGYNSLVTIVQPPVGRYRVRLSRAGALSEPVPFRITLLQDSDVRLGLVLPSRDALAGTPYLLAAVLFEGEHALQGATLRMTITPQQADSPVSREQALPDDGRGVDFARSDGIYTNTLTAPAPGRYIVAVVATGNTSAGIPYERHAGFTFDASEPTVQIGGIAGAQWHNGRARTIDRLTVPLQLKGRPGNYEIWVTIAASNGNRINARQAVALGSSGAVRATVAVDGAQFRILGVDGPYRLESVDVFEIGDGVRILRGRRIGTESTPPADLRAIPPG